MQTTSTQHVWTAPDGEIFSYSRWAAQGDTRAVLVAVHGLSGAALDFQPLGERMAPLGFATFALELRGQGNDPAPRRRGDLASLDEWYRDLATFFALVRAQHPGLPVFYYGESMGAALLTRFVARAEAADLPAGLILASPVVALNPAPLWQESIFRSFLLVHPTFRLNVRKLAKRKKGGEPKWVTRDEAHRAWFETVPHKLDAFTIRFFNCLRQLISGCYEAAPRIETPVLILYAANDIFITTVKVEEFFHLLGSPRKQLRLFPESYHLLLHDFDKLEVLSEVESWLLLRLAACKAGA